MSRGKHPPNPSWAYATALVGERVLLLEAERGAEPRQTRHDWKRHGVPWYILGPLVVIAAAQSLPVPSPRESWAETEVPGLERLVDQLKTAYRRHPPGSPGWTTLINLLSALSGEPPVEDATLMHVVGRRPHATAAEQAAIVAKGTRRRAGGQK